MPILSSLAKNLKQVAYNLSDLEMKVLEATNTDPWGPHGTAMYEIASACINHEAFGQVFTILKKRLAIQGENWRQVYKALLVIEYMIKHCPRFVVEHIKDENNLLRKLKYFQYKSPDGRDQGINVRTRAETLIKLLQDGDALNDERLKAKTATRKLAKGFSRDTQDYYKNSPTGYKSQYGNNNNNNNNGYEQQSSPAPSTASSSAALEAPVKVNISSNLNAGSAQSGKMTLSQTKVNSKISATFANYAGSPAAPAPTPQAAPVPSQGAGEVWADFSTGATSQGGAQAAPAGGKSNIDLLGGLEVPAAAPSQPVAGSGGPGVDNSFDAFGQGSNDPNQGFADFTSAPPAAAAPPPMAEDPFAQNKSAVEAAFNSAPAPAMAFQQQMPSAAPAMTQPAQPAAQNMFPPQQQQGFGGMAMPPPQQHHQPMMQQQPGMMPPQMMMQQQPGMMPPQMMMQQQPGMQPGMMQQPGMMPPQMMMQQQPGMMPQQMMMQAPQGFNGGMMPQQPMMQAQPSFVQQQSTPPPPPQQASATSKESTPSKDLFADLLN